MSDPKHPRLIAGPETAAVRKPEWRLGREDPSHPRLIAGGARRMRLAAWSLLQSGKKQTVGGMSEAKARKAILRPLLPSRNQITSNAKTCPLPPPQVSVTITRTASVLTGSKLTLLRRL